MNYELIDCGEGKRIEQFGEYRLERPCGIALWPLQKQLTSDAIYTREPKGSWEMKKKLPENWELIHEGVRFIIKPTPFGHVGLFAEHAKHFEWIRRDSKGEVLNLFAYSGGASIAAAQAGAKVCHVDASKGMVQWARENAELNQLEKAPIRWIADDAIKFVKREVKRERKYQGIILDPPSFGRGSQGQVFKIEDDLLPLLRNSKELLAKDANYLLLTCHTPGYSPIVLKQLLQTVFGNKGTIKADEMWIDAKSKRKLPLGAYALWRSS